MKETKDLQAARVAVEIAESQVIQTGRELALLVLAGSRRGKLNKEVARFHARLFLRREQLAEKLRLEYTIDYVNEGAKQIDEMIPEAK